MSRTGSPGSPMRLVVQVDPVGGDGRHAAIVPCRVDLVLPCVRDAARRMRRRRAGERTSSRITGALRLLRDPPSGAGDLRATAAPGVDRREGDDAGDARPEARHPVLRHPHEDHDADGDHPETPECETELAGSGSRDRSHRLGGGVGRAVEGPLGPRGLGGEDGEAEDEHDDARSGQHEHRRAGEHDDPDHEHGHALGVAQEPTEQDRRAVDPEPLPPGGRRGGGELLVGHGAVAIEAEAIHDTTVGGLRIGTFRALPPACRPRRRGPVRIRPSVERPSPAGATSR